MKPIIVTNIAGEKRRLNPLMVVGWAAAEIALPPATGKPHQRMVLGCKVQTIGAVVEVQESETQFDFLFEKATEGLFLSPDVHEQFSAIVSAAVEARLSASGDGEAQPS